MAKFKIGDKVKVINVHLDTSYLGKIFEVTIPKLIGFCPVTNKATASVAVNERCEINDCGYIMFDESHLQLVYDGDEKSNWSECAWRPKEKIVG